MKKVILLSDVVGIWIFNDKNAYKKLTDSFFRRHKINLKLVEKVDKEIFPILAKMARKGEITYRECIEKYFEAIDSKNYKKLAREYIEFEFKNLKKYIKLYKYSRSILLTLKRMGVKIIGVRDSVYSVKEMKKILKILKIERYFEGMYTSNSCKMEKPELFQLFKNGENKVFLGHDSDELLGAKKYGFITIGLKNRKADYHISSIKQLPGVIKWLKKKRNL
ncbi:MAG: HAD hydrolase-like protein [Candidatus Aenigmarchaeota archaeon]|nr:HAD hydrolase-like protein [Candidatus Aenigmarchaeota archaeon]MDW8149737.1 HAD hydrolase-like protein [Candidatus Aenigmarchaeota archaeon]